MPNDLSRQPGLFDREGIGLGQRGPIAPGNGIEDGGSDASTPGHPEPSDAPARRFAVDPRNDVVLEASAGTGKTTVLVRRYLNLLAAGVDPANILAITFTRKASAEMRDRIVRELRRDADTGPEGRRRWIDLRDRLGDIGISTIDAFCLSLLREFPLEADLDPSFQIADETEVARLTDAALDKAVRICRTAARDDEDIALVFAELSATRLREGLRHLLDRRLVAPSAIRRYLRGVPRNLTGRGAVIEAVGGALVAMGSAPGGTAAIFDDGPLRNPRFRLLVAGAGVGQPGAGQQAEPVDPGAMRAWLDELRAYFLTARGEPRKRPHGYRADESISRAAWARHVTAVAAIAPAIHGVLDRFASSLNTVIVRGVWRVFSVALDSYRRSLDEHDVVDFPEALERAVRLLGQMDEFAQSRYRLESRYHHVLVDEFQDTSRLQWDLVARLIESWGEGFGLVHEAPLPPSVFIVGDRKQSIYRFRDAEVAVLDEAARFIAALRPAGSPRRAIAHSFRASPELLAFVNDLFAAVDRIAERPDAFRFEDQDRFPADTRAPSDDVDRHADPVHTPDALGVIAEPGSVDVAEAAAAEIERLLRDGTVRDPLTGLRRAVRTGDIAILFRTRESHRDFESALEARGIPAYVYKGLGFFEADEVKDLTALLRFLAAPDSRSRTAAFLRSRLVRISDRALLALRAELTSALTAERPPAAWSALGDEDRRVLERARASVPRWLALVDRVPPSELLDQVLAESAYAYELRGPRRLQATENVKKLRALVRRVQNRGYATLERIAAHLERLSAGDESNAAVDAVDAVNLMTIHAAKGLEFPIVFLVHVGRGAGTTMLPVRVVADAGDPAVSVGSFRSQADDDEVVREREETKRLLYVAVTRARDRLYLGATVPASGFRPARGSLGEVMPSGFSELFDQAAVATTARVSWAVPGGRRHDLVVCRRYHPIGSTHWAARPSCR